MLSGGATGHDRSSIRSTNRKLATASKPVLARTRGLVLTRAIGGGLHEDIDTANHGSAPVRFSVEIGRRCDFADLFKVKAGTAIRHGSVETKWST